MKALITGGAGYIGSHLVELLILYGWDITVLDNLSTGHLWACQNAQLKQVDLTDRKSVFSAFHDENFDVVFHFAAKSIVSESTLNPSLYYYTNLAGTINLLDAMIQNGVKKFVFSSTAAVYGRPISDLNIDENHPTDPINVYGKSKLMVENIIEDYCKAYDLGAVVFRYFNAAGASQSGVIGELHYPETHLIPNILKSLMQGGEIRVFGNDYKTYDGTCIRDYIHVSDLAMAHKLGSDLLGAQKGFEVFNLGTEQGYSVFDVINHCQSTLNKEANVRVYPRRIGDPDRLVATNAKCRQILNWEPKHSSITEIIQTAWDWEIKIAKYLSPQRLSQPQ